MINLIVICKVAPFVRLSPATSCIPATLCTVPQRTSQQSEKPRVYLLLINRIELLPRCALSAPDFSQHGLHVRYAPKAKLCFRF